MRPPATLYIPKFSIPNVFNINLEVYKDIRVTMSIRIYNMMVFFAIVLLCDIN